VFRNLAYICTNIVIILVTQLYSRKFASATTSISRKNIQKKFATLKLKQVWWMQVAERYSMVR